MEALRSAKNIDKILIQKGMKKELFGEIRQLASATSIPYQFVPVEKLNRITGKNHQGLIAFLSIVEYYEIENLVPFLYEQGKEPFLLILDEITDVRNFGAIARSAECFGVDGIIIPAKGAAQINEDALKTSAGALNTIPVCRSTSLVNASKFIKQSGIKLIAATEKTDKLLTEGKLKGPIAIIMGSEEKGIHPALLELADEKYKIPITGKVSSLNVSVAAGVCLYEVRRQRVVAGE